MIYYVSAVLMFSILEVLSKNLPISPYALTFVRFLIGGAVLMPIALVSIRKEKRGIAWIDIMKMWLLGSLLMLSCVLFQIALVNTTVSLCVFIFSLNTILMVFTGQLFLGERPHRRIWLTCGIAFAGLAVIIDPLRDGVNGYALIALASCVLFSMFNTLAYKLGKTYGNLACTSISFFLGSISLGIVLLLSGASLVQGIDASNLFRVLVLGIICSGAVYLAYYKAMAVTSVSFASSVFILKPVLATIIAAISLKEIPTAQFLIGSVLILTGIAISFRAKQEVVS